MNMTTFGPASFFVSLIFLLLLIGLLVVGLLRLNGPARALVGAGLGVLILVRVLGPLVQGPLLGSVVAASGSDAYFMLMFIASTVMQLITFIGVGLLVFGAIRGTTSAMNRPPAPSTEPSAEPPRSEHPAGPPGQTAGAGDYPGRSYPSRPAGPR